MTPRPVLALVVLLSAACGPSRDERPRPATRPSTAAPAAAAPAPAASPSQALADAEVNALLDAWLAAQNRGDFEAYQALYAQRFHGVRRTRERVVALDRKGWLADRRRMFERPMVVSLDQVRIAKSSTSAVVDVVQTWSSARFADTGPKRFLVVREGGALRIAQEEMLASRPASAATELASRGLFPVIVGTNAKVALLGRASGDAGKEAPGLVTAANAVPVAVARDATNVPESLASLEGSSVRVVGASSVCDGRLGRVRLVRALVPHFGTVNHWLGQGDFEGEPAMRPAAVAREAWELGTVTYYAAELTSACEGVVAVPSRGGAPVVFAPSEPDARTATSILDALASSPEGARIDHAFAELRQELGDEAEESEIPSGVRGLSRDRLELQSFGAPARLFAAKLVPDGCGQMDPVEGLAFFDARADGLRFTDRGSIPERARVVAVFDLEGDGVLEAYLEDVIGGFRYVVRLGAAPGVLVEAEIPYFDCPC
ncbi:MAG: DUF4440 domain-containing protein [Polyangiales bacterium]